MKPFSSVARFVAALLLAANVSNMSAANFGYCTDVVDRSFLFRVGSTQKQGLAIRFSHEKLASLKGCTISSVTTALGSKRMTGGAVTFFIATSPDAEPLVSQKVTVSSATKWLTFALDQTYTITGDEPCLYVGYTGEISVSSNMLMSDFTADSQGCSFTYKDGEWVDMYGMGVGNASIRVGIDDAPSITDLMMKPLNVEGYFKAGQEYTLTGQLFNCGSETVSRFDLVVSVGDAAPTTMKVEGVSVAPGATYDFTLPVWRSDVEGDVALRMSVDNVNGDSDSDATDNGFDKSVYCYPAAMERNILVEGFTGQACSNCPSGHTVLNQFIATAATTPVIEVMHHSGYQPDFFTMDSDLDYTFFYGSSSTYAPAVMMNRATVVGTVPVMNTSAGNLQAGYELLERMQPYVSLSLESDYDPATREVSVKLGTLAHVDMPTTRCVVNVMLVQDNLVAKQVPYGEGYIHNAVFRGVLTGNSWGVAMDVAATKKGGKYLWEKTFTLPESIFSDYYDASSFNDEQIAQCSWAAVPEDMRLVAYVAAYGETTSDNMVYNAVEVPLGKSHAQGGFQTAVESVECDDESVKMYTLNGIAVAPGAQLPSGVYIVRKGNKTFKVRL